MGRGSSGAEGCLAWLIDFGGLKACRGKNVEEDAHCLFFFKTERQVYGSRENVGGGWKGNDRDGIEDRDDKLVYHSFLTNLATTTPTKSRYRHSAT